jgi:predicted HAD superfamily Cof-like phosphohydrolase
MKSEHQRRIEAFMKGAGQELPDKPTMPSLEVRKLRASLILEEALETIQDGLGLKVVIDGDVDFRAASMEDFSFEVVGAGDIVAAVDGLTDLSVVTIGTLSAFGIPDLPVLAEVDMNNLAKLGPGSSRRADGKLIKPPGHKPPDFAAILEKLSKAD